ncbi:DMSO/TMAO reductase YedYZ, molybdopterin-dependent catalytic subunit [Catalinimonas alkaloidigena]|uniref:DMSO/TMAO reductase YedYZ, molybdopterin-dependent catalytic subunit n=1 Tax=Catalinimonas alkaloidigena TaxID=1075417 RepID=A0A1G8ZYL8_9BACT|nr:molybdopterin-dependent oxidoreductase [Catalinimonas alkaloidigena]SDK20232.1 DMSO/TMAO reductase YedYZ, molybdopterin-dependent catalytic subunit [Catalinimonas alkaloidigena]
MNTQETKPTSAEDATERTIKRRTFLSFTVFTLASAGGVGLWSWFRDLPKTAARRDALTRGVLEFNEKVNNVFFSDAHLAKTFPVERAAAKPRVNGGLGVDKNYDFGSWQLNVEQPGGTSQTLQVGDLQPLPRTELVYDFKCIEGWDQIVHYGGVRFSDFVRHFNLGTRSGQPITEENPDDWYRYVGLETPDNEYYVGIDMQSMLHPQTILCFELNGKELPPDHGAPLRLIIPTKYGIKSLKRIGRLFFADERPRDYWYERGYDYDSAL